MTKSLYQKVHGSYMTALGNSYNLDTQDAEWVATDMQRCDADLEDESYNQILECVKKIQNSRKLNG